MKWLTRDRVVPIQSLGECFLTDLRENWLRSAKFNKETFAFR